MRCYISVSRQGELRFGTPAGTIAATGVVLNSAAWAHVAAAYDGAELWVVVDGMEVTRVRAIGAKRGEALALNPIVIGGGEGGGAVGPFFHGWAGTYTRPLFSST